MSKIGKAFQSLQVVGVFAREDYHCCQSCGGAAITQEIETARSNGQNPIGYAFYHEQDLDSAKSHGELYIAYGAADDDGDSVAVGNLIVNALKASGLDRVEWNGSADERILVRVKPQVKRR